MTIENTTTFTLPAAPAYEHGNSYELRSSIHKSRILTEWCKCDDDENAQDAFFQDTLGLDGKAAYLAFRDNLKAWLRVFAISQKELKGKMHAPGGCSTSQMHAYSSAMIITLLIEIRRASKRWAGKQMAKARQTEAA